MNALRFVRDFISDAASHAAYLVLILLVVAAAWVVLSVLASPFLGPPAQASGGTVAVDNANEGQPLPLRYAHATAVIPGVRGVVYYDKLSLACKGSAPGVFIQGFGGSHWAIVHLRQLWPASSPELVSLQRRWFADSMGVLVGTRTARDCGWYAGLGVSPKDIFNGKPIEIHVTGVLPRQRNPIANIVSFGHYDYTSRVSATGHYGSVEEIIAFPADPGDATALAARIEAAFANDDPPIMATTNATLQNAMARYGQAQYVLGYVMLAIFLCAALVLVSVLAHTIGQRRRQLAVLQVLGFSRAMLFGSFALEGLIIVMVGAGLGTGAGLLILRNLPDTLRMMFGGFVVPTWTWWGLPVWLGVLLIAALVIPAATIARLRPVDVRAL